MLDLSIEPEPKTLKIQGPLLGVESVVITASGRGYPKGLNSAATEIVSEADDVQEEKGETKERNGLENGKHSTYHSE